ncbi:MAG: peptide chain release factor 2 [Candidatus Peribacteraceae bacterium]|nr:peptide chain release factor 2 [Candidatus Peribacteraceae bacterium]
MQDIKKTLHDATELVLEGQNRVKSAKLAEKIKDLEQQMEASDFWDNPKRAQKISRELANLQKTVNAWKELAQEHADLLELVEMTQEEDAKAIEEIRKEAINFENKLQEAETALFLSGEYDSSDAILEIKVGAGGVDAADWAEMLLRMYLRFCEKKGWKTEILEKSEAEEAGIRSATVEIHGENAFGLLKGEKGGHRLVRRSPFNSAHSRETSFAKVEILPLIDDDSDIEIQSDEIKVETFGASGAGGQHVNRTDSAVRITHLPTEIVVSCQNERSQHQNKERALEILRSKLAEQQLEEREAEEAKLRGKAVKADFGGDTIRSYVLDDKRVKDARTGLETHDPDKFLDGDIEEFLRAYLISKK